MRSEKLWRVRLMGNMSTLLVVYCELMITEVVEILGCGSACLHFLRCWLAKIGEIGLKVYGRIAAVGSKW